MLQKVFFRNETKNAGGIKRLDKFFMRSSKKFFRRSSKIVTCISLAILSGCATQVQPRPDNIENVCYIFTQYPEWYISAKRVEHEWGIPVPVQMAIIYQESSFDAKAQPSRRKLLWVIPWKRRSSAYGYSQALKNTWIEYEDSVGRTCRRSDFHDAVDFIGWYGARIQKKFHLNKTDAYDLYLAYHEGSGGFARKTYLKKRWLIQVAHKVSARSQRYARQLTNCHLVY